MPLQLNRSGSLASTLGLSALGLLLVVGMLRSSDATVAAQGFMLSQPVLRDQLGEPLEVGWWVLGYVRNRNGSGSAGLRFPVKGSRGATTAQVTLVGQHGLWQVTAATYEDAEGIEQTLMGPRQQRPGLAKAPVSGPREQAQQALVNAHSLYRSGQARRALEELDRVVALDERNAEAWYWRAQVHTRLGEREQARRDIEKAFATGVQLREAYQLYDDLLAPSREWDAILAAWTRYLDAHPRDDMALLGRAGTWHHVGDDARARKDLEQSCALGNARACELRQRVAGAPSP